MLAGQNKRMAGRIWSAGRSLPMPVLDSLIVSVDYDQGRIGG